MNYVPMYDHVLVKREAKETTKTDGGIVVERDRSRLEIQRGVVLRIGEGKLLDNGQVSEPRLRPGDVIHYSHLAAKSTLVEEEEYDLIREENVLMIESRYEEPKKGKGKKDPRTIEVTEIKIDEPSVTRKPYAH